MMKHCVAAIWCWARRGHFLPQDLIAADIKYNKRVTPDKVLATKIKKERKKAEVLVELATLLIPVTATAEHSKLVKVRDEFEELFGGVAPALMRSTMLQARACDLIRHGDFEELASCCSTVEPTIGGAVDKTVLLKLNAMIFEDGFQFLLQGKSIGDGEIEKAASFCQTIVQHELLDTADREDITQLYLMLNPKACANGAELVKADKHLTQLQHDPSYVGLLKGVLAKTYPKITKASAEEITKAQTTSMLGTAVDNLGAWIDDARKGLKTVALDSSLTFKLPMGRTGVEMKEAIAHVFAPIESGKMSEKEATKINDLMQPFVDTTIMMAASLFTVMYEYTFTDKVWCTAKARIPQSKSFIDSAHDLIRQLDFKEHLSDTMFMSDTFRSLHKSFSRGLKIADAAKTIMSKVALIRDEEARISEGSCFDDRALRLVMDCREAIVSTLSAIAEIPGEVLEVKLIGSLKERISHCLQPISLMCDRCVGSTVENDITAFKEPLETYSILHWSMFMKLFMLNHCKSMMRKFMIIIAILSLIICAMML